MYSLCYEPLNTVFQAATQVQPVCLSPSMFLMIMDFVCTIVEYCQIPRLPCMIIYICMEKNRGFVIHLHGIIIFRRYNARDCSVYFHNNRENCRGQRKKHLLIIYCPQKTLPSIRFGSTNVSVRLLSLYFPPPLKLILRRNSSSLQPLQNPHPLHQPSLQLRLHTPALHPIQSIQLRLPFLGRLPPHLFDVLRFLLGAVDGILDVAFYLEGVFHVGFEAVEVASSLVVGALGVAVDKVFDGGVALYGKFFAEGLSAFCAIHVGN
mmetsp:Transcript_27782/g.51803  ORF Transcript_27782/g.51803 Transcript_27782/m.51803 type:complete len:264 (+) Transcript_27782:27-818(+)